MRKPDHGLANVAATSRVAVKLTCVFATEEMEGVGAVTMRFADHPRDVERTFTTSTLWAEVVPAAVSSLAGAAAVTASLQLSAGKQE